MMDNRGGLECWISNGQTCCINCGCNLTGSKPVRLQPPRTCAICKKEITDKWPSDENLA